jgi:hypothetical protein
MHGLSSEFRLGHDTPHPYGEGASGKLTPGGSTCSRRDGVDLPVETNLPTHRPDHDPSGTSDRDTAPDDRRRRRGVRTSPGGLRYAATRPLDDLGWETHSWRDPHWRLDRKALGRFSGCLRVRTLSAGNNDGRAAPMLEGSEWATGTRAERRGHAPDRGRAPVPWGTVQQVDRSVRPLLAHGCPDDPGRSRGDAERGDSAPLAPNESRARPRD